jgi:hypothetical protein
MQEDELIPVQHFCSSHQLEISFIDNLHHYGLLEITTLDEMACIHVAQLPLAEKMARLYSDLGINLEGIDVINHLLQRMEKMQDELIALKNKLDRYE